MRCLTKKKITKMYPAFGNPEKKNKDWTVARVTGQ